MQRTKRQNLWLALIVLYLLVCLATFIGIILLTFGYDEPIFKSTWWVLLLVCLAASLGHQLNEIFGFESRRKRQGRPAKGFEHLRGYFFGYPSAEDDAAEQVPDADGSTRSGRRH
ncbi:MULTISPECIES: hypothetical protein [unclassified Rathayibacter]|jgi:hypothetical protein|uniref:hypothetical protein n=1 Tax=unclassified Rathayibacter TaxID=2609250 RepID=UPI000CE88B7B|nr:MULTISPECIES: hypothetical protein [unclassified Rathayibacter]PPG56525.1 hypothetical protein C5C57_14775 [Rathayibacter sp. AY1C5]PPH31263.1 hypothetical protein C5C37_01840 [Rathayibacter sp. AY1F9]